MSMSPCSTSPPPLSLMAVSIKTVLNVKSKQNEVRLFLFILKEADANDSFPSDCSYRCIVAR